ncbi:MAG: HD domain-containing protein [Butyrivibrio sp.]|nr:HD domain-containing protein [Butyrivibrio sp.]
MVKLIKTFSKDKKVIEPEGGKIVSGSSKAKNKNVNRKQITLPLLLCVLCVLLNIGGKITAQSNGFPFFFDTPGIILASVLGGYVPGIIVAILTNLTITLSDPGSIYFCCVSVLIALFTVWYYRKEKKRNFKSLLIYTFVIALIGGGIGGLIQMYLYGPEITSGNEFLIGAMQEIGIDTKIAWYIVNFLFDCIDKIISVSFAEIILYLIPHKIWSKFKFAYWLQEPFKNKKKLNSRQSINGKMVIVLIISAITTTTICTAICIRLFETYSIQQHTYLVESVAQVAASAIDADSVDKYLTSGSDYESYKETEKILKSLMESTTDIEYVYVYKIKADGCHVVFDLDPNEETRANIGEVISFDPSFMDYVPDLLTGKRIDPIVSNDSYGWLLSAYEPVYDSTGDCVCYAGADISMDGLNLYKYDFLIKVICIYLGFMILNVALALWLAKYHIVMPINAMSQTADEFEYDDEFSRKLNVEKLSALDICTDDEIERLYRVFLRTTEESTRYFEENKIKLEKIDLMQSSLVMVLADMVENRDGSTGAHVRKTAAYVGIIARKMRELGYYKDKMTDKFIQDSIRSAPLHDIGKISVPDAVLNKPGKLDDEEFAIMKTHTTNGKDVISQAIETLPDADYLEEARNMAGYHHEKWNGTGYPEGLAGEDIPLSARIMAVADVFDALVSKRCYKDSFSYEKAFGIIEKDAGVHFDPLVADAFLKSKDEVIEIADRFAEKQS